MIRDRGGIALEYPLIEIVPPRSSQTLNAIAERLERFPVLIFISRNAVQYGLPWFGEHIDPTRQRLFAVGRSTAQALQQAGFDAVRYPGGGADSETLLQLPELSAGRIDGAGILIVRGLGGRELLAQTLRERGATITYAEVYERVQPCYDLAHETEFWRRHNPDIVILTSCEAANNLLQRVPDEFQDKLRNADTVVMSRRIADYLVELGFRQPAAIIRQSDDEGIIEMCEELCRNKDA